VTAYSPDDTTPVDAAAEAARVLSERPFAPCDIWRGPGDPPESGEDDDDHAIDPARITTEADAISRRHPLSPPVPYAPPAPEPSPSDAPESGDGDEDVSGEGQDSTRDELQRYGVAA